MSIAALILLAALAQKGEPADDAAALMEKLGSASYAEREATKSIEKLGASALPALRLSLKSKDPEVRTRARSLINKIEGNLLTQASMVRLDFKDSTLDEIARSLSKQTGVEISVGVVRVPQARNELGTRRITLVEPRPVSFWTAVNRLCEIARLAHRIQLADPQGLGRPRPALVLLNAPRRPAEHSSEHGPFLLNVVSIFYTSRLTFTSPGQVPFQVHAGALAPGVAGQAKATDLTTAEEPPLKTVQFQVQLQVTPEPRMTISRTGAVQLEEAVDELGQSLMPSAGADARPMPSSLNGMGATYGGSAMASHLSVSLQRPDAHGKLIKKLAGTVEISVSTPSQNALVIPLEGAVGKTFQNDDRRVVVRSVDLDPMRHQKVIVFQVDNLDELFPTESANRPASAGPIRMPAVGMGTMIGGDSSQWMLQVVATNGRNQYSQTSIDWESGNVTLRVTTLPQQGDPKEVRISGMIRASAKVPFEFHDLPMP